MPIPNPLRLLEAISALSIPTPGEMNTAGEKKILEDEISNLIQIHSDTHGLGSRAESSRAVEEAIAKYENAGFTFNARDFDVRPNQFRAPGSPMVKPKVVEGGVYGQGGQGHKKAVIP